MATPSQAAERASTEQPRRRGFGCWFVGGAGLLLLFGGILFLGLKEGPPRPAANGGSQDAGETSETGPTDDLPPVEITGEELKPPLRPPYEVEANELLADPPDIGP